MNKRLGVVFIITLLILFFFIGLKLWNKNFISNYNRVISDTNITKIIIHRFTGTRRSLKTMISKEGIYTQNKKGEIKWRSIDATKWEDIQKQIDIDSFNKLKLPNKLNSIADAGEITISINKNGNNIIIDFDATRRALRYNTERVKLGKPQDINKLENLFKTLNKYKIH